MSSVLVGSPFSARIKTDKSVIEDNSAIEMINVETLSRKVRVILEVDGDVCRTYS